VLRGIAGQPDPVTIGSRLTNQGSALHLPVAIERFGNSFLEAAAVGCAMITAFHDTSCLSQHRPRLTGTPNFSEAMIGCTRMRTNERAEHVDTVGLGVCQLTPPRCSSKFELIPCGTQFPVTACGW
jgi:hypothetical protein